MFETEIKENLNCRSKFIVDIQNCKFKLEINKDYEEEVQEIIEEILKENRESIVYYEKLSRKFEVLDNIENLIEKISDIETDIIDEKIETDDEDIITLSNRINELQEHIRKIMNKD